MRALRAAGVSTWHAPEDALEDFIASRAPKRESRKAETKPRYEEWLRGKE